MRERIAIIDGVRTPYAKAGGSLARFGADDLGAIAVRELMARTGYDPAKLDECIVGNVAQPADAANVARVVALKAGLPQTLIASTVHRNCASGMEAITTAAAKILSGDGEVMVCAGIESMSNIPLMFGRKMTDLFAALMRAKGTFAKLAVWARFRPSMLTPIVGVQLGLTDPINGLIMGKTAEILAREFAISREAQDAFALESHIRASKATKAGLFAQEIVSVPMPPKFEHMLSEDDGIRHEQTIESLAKLRPYFDKVAGTVTVGNSSQLTDGACAVLVMPESRAIAEGLKPLGFLRSYAYAALDGARMGLGPVFATAKVFQRSGLSMKDIQLIEINEAFAAQVIACSKAFASDDFAKRELGLDHALGAIDPKILNVNGGGIALGHPVGSTGARLVTTILKEMKRRKLQRGLASLCIGGGQGAALILESE
jgi:acetyl-CoA acetyltransferase family protein